MKQFSVGDRAHSAAVGNRAAFDGEVAERIDAHALYIEGRWIWIDRYYHVRDEDGRLWHRVDSELTPHTEVAENKIAAA